MKGSFESQSSIGLEQVKGLLFADAHAQGGQIAVLLEPRAQLLLRLPHQLGVARDLGVEVPDPSDPGETLTLGVEDELAHLTDGRTAPGLAGDGSYKHTQLARGIYADQLLRWREFFPEERMLVIKSEDFFADVPGTLVAASLRPKMFAATSPTTPATRWQ